MILNSCEFSYPGDHRRHWLVDLPGNSGALGCKLVGVLLDSFTKGGGLSSPREYSRCQRDHMVWGVRVEIANTGILAS